MTSWPKSGARKRKSKPGGMFPTGVAGAATPAAVKKVKK
jgi:hypothetical protein